jgi:site-specific DNA-methyltransferase (adenine-specific)
MGKAWDTHTPRGFQAWCEAWGKEALRVLKPGGHLLAFGGTRTYHRLTSGIEDAGFEIRDSLHWLYGSGFPKSLDVSKAIDKAGGAERERIPYTGGFQPGASQAVNADLGARYAGTRQVTAPATEHAKTWKGWGTALKPAHEPIVLARKPLQGTVAANVLQYGTGALNVDGCRVGAESRTYRPAGTTRSASMVRVPAEKVGVSGEEVTVSGRWPANVLLDGEAAGILDEQSDGASRFFPVFKYQAKAGKRERPEVDGVKHPTVKPVELMRWLVRLVTPPGGLVLDPFAGSGATLEAAQLEGMRAIGIELTAEYLPLIEQRLAKYAEAA